MSPSLDQIVEAVVERIMSKATRKPYPPKRQPPRVYTKRLKNSSRTIPDARLPTGPMPEEPWYDAHYDEAVVPLIGEAFEEYALEHAYRSKMARYQAELAMSSFLTGARLHEHEPVWTITRVACRLWREVMQAGKATTPPARNKRVANAATLDKRLRVVNHFTKWLVDKDYLQANPMEGLTFQKRLVSACRTRKAGFTDEEMVKIIPALLALSLEESPRTEFKWVALALMFSGARCMEILQLRHSDVKAVDEVVCFDFNRGEGNFIKNEPSIRLVPVHSQLVTLGFLDWIASAKGKPTDRLFPLIHPKGSPLPSMWFTRMLERLVIKRPAVSLHSLRHSVTQKLTRARTFPPLQNRILGHAIGKSVEDRVYNASLEFTVLELAEAMEKITFPLS